MITAIFGVVCFFIGGFVGVLTTALMVAAGRSDDIIERKREGK